MEGKGEVGEPKSSDTAERLLAVGRRMFSKSGFDGTSVRALTAEAGANLGAVTYHFDTKDGLYQAVLASVFGPVRDGVSRLAQSPLPAQERLELFVRVMFHHMKEHHDLPRFMVREIVLGDEPSPEVLETVRTVLGSLSTIMRDGQEEGKLVQGDPVLLALTLLSQPIYLSLMPRFLGREDLRDAELPEPLESAEGHVIALLRRAFFVSQEEPK